MRSSLTLFAAVCATSLALSVPANAAAILQFQQQNNTDTPIVASSSGGVTTLTTTGSGAVPANPPGWIPVFVTILGAPVAQPAFMSFTTPLTSGGSASQSGSTILQDGYGGTIQFNFTPTPAAATNILTITFTGGLLTGNTGGNSATFSASQPPSSVTFTSGIPEVQAAINATDGRNFGIGFSGLTSNLALSGSPATIGGFSASASGTFSTSSGAVIPEPSSVVMASISALAGLGCVGWRRFRKS